MIERLLEQHLQQHGQELQTHLARYNGVLAIFCIDAPDDNDSGWENDDRYGRIVFTAATEFSRERNTRGRLTVDVICSRGSHPEEIERVVRPLIDGWFFNVTGEVISANWKESGYSVEPDKGICKATLVFELYGYPVQRTTGPDPVARINQWSAEELGGVLNQNVYVIGWSNLPDVFKPTEDHPAIYWRLSKTGKCTWIPETKACSWQTAVVRGHIMTPGSEEAPIFIARVIDNALSAKRKLLFDDESPLLVDRNIRIERNVRLQRSGQISVDATYGVLNLPQQAEVLKKINLKER